MVNTTNITQNILNRNLVLDLLLSIKCLSLGKIVSLKEDGVYNVEIGGKQKNFYQIQNAPIIPCRALTGLFFQGQYDIGDEVVILFTDFNQENFIDKNLADSNVYDINEPNNFHNYSNAIILCSYQQLNNAINDGIRIINKAKTCSVELKDSGETNIKAKQINLSATTIKLKQSNSLSSNKNEAPAMNLEYDTPLDPKNTTLNKTMGEVFAKDLPETIAGNVVAGLEMLYNMIKNNLPEVAGVNIGDSLPDFDSFKQQIEDYLKQLLQPFIALVEMVLKFMPSNITLKTTYPVDKKVNVIIDREKKILDGNKTYQEQGYNILYMNNIYNPYDIKEYYNGKILLKYPIINYPQDNDKLWTNCIKHDYSAIADINDKGNIYQRRLETHKTFAEQGLSGFGIDDAIPTRNKQYQLVK